MPRSPGNVPASRSTLSCGVIAWFVSPISVPLLPVAADPIPAPPAPAAPGYDAGAMVRAREDSASGRPARGARPSTALVIGGIASVQFGAALATTLFDRTGPAGTALLRLAFGSLVLLAVWRPRLAGRSREELSARGPVRGRARRHEPSFYGAIDRIPLGIAVALEFVGPLTVALLGSRRRRTCCGSLSRRWRIIALTRHGVQRARRARRRARARRGSLWGTYIILNARLGRAFEGGTGLALAMCVGTVAVAPIGLVEGAGEAERRSAAGRRGRRDPVLGDPVLVRGRGAAADPSGGLRRADEPRAGRRGARRAGRARPAPRRAGAARDRARDRASVGAARSGREAAVTVCAGA